MKTATLVIFVSLVGVSGFSRDGLRLAPQLALNPQTGSREADRREILNAYNAARNAHFHHDAAAFLSHNDAEWHSVADGAVSLRKKAAEQPRIQSYFDSVKFTEITDLDPPQIEISSDGSMAWLLGHVRVRGTQRQANGVDTPLAFDSAWIDVWQKKNGEWRIVARANTEKSALGNK